MTAAERRALATVRGNSSVQAARGDPPTDRRPSGLVSSESESAGREQGLSSSLSCQQDTATARPQH